MKKQIEKYISSGAKLSIFLVNGERITPDSYSSIELQEDCFLYKHLDEIVEIYPYTSILKIQADITIPA